MKRSGNEWMEGDGVEWSERKRELLISICGKERERVGGSGKEREGTEGSEEWCLSLKSGKAWK